MVPGMAGVADVVSEVVADGVVAVVGVVVSGVAVVWALTATIKNADKIANAIP